MLTGIRRTTGALLLCSAVAICGGLASVAFGESPCADRGAQPKKPCGICDVLFPKKDKPCGKTVEQPPPKSPCAAQACPTADLPPSAEPGECYAKVIVPAEFKTVTERHLVQEPSERIEVVPAQFKWVEEQVTVKEPSTKLEVVPAEYTWKEKTIEVKPAHTGWVVQAAADCANPDKAARGDVFCYRTTPPVFKTIKTQCLLRPASVRQISIPGEYQTIRRQVVASAATTRKVCIPAEYENVDKTVMVCPERVKWEHIVCEDKLSSATVNKVKTALLVAGFKPGPANGKFQQEDRNALIAFQQTHRLGVGQLSYETLKQLGVSMQ